jgi:hypothetical protein
LANLSVDAVSKVDCNYRRSIEDNSLLVNSQDTQTNFTPAFVDANKRTGFAKVEWVLGTYHKINTNTNLNAKTKFGTIDNPMALTVYYEGQEKINTTLILEL